MRGIGLTLKELGSVGAEKTPQRQGKPKRGRDASPLTIQELLKRPHKAAKPMLDWNTVVEMCEMRVAVESEEAKEAKRLCEWMLSERGEEVEEWVRGYMESHDPNEELVVVMKELMKARLKCDVRGSEGSEFVRHEALDESAGGGKLLHHPPGLAPQGPQLRFLSEGLPSVEGIEGGLLFLLGLCGVRD